MLLLLILLFWFSSQIQHFTCIPTFRCIKPAPWSFKNWSTFPSKSANFHLPSKLCIMMWRMNNKRGFGAYPFELCGLDECVCVFLRRADTIRVDGNGNPTPSLNLHKELKVDLTRTHPTAISACSSSTCNCQKLIICNCHWSLQRLLYYS